MTALDQNCGHGDQNCMLTSSGDGMHRVNSRPCRVGGGFPGTQMTMSRGHYRNVRRLLGLRGPAMRTVVLSSTFRRHRMGTKLGVLLASFRQLLYSSTLLPTKELHRPSDNGGQTRVIVIAGYPSSVGPVSFGVVTGQLRLCPCRRLCFSEFHCKVLAPLFPRGAGDQGILSSLAKSRRMLLIANVTSPTPLRGRIRSCAPRIGLLTFSSRRSFAPGSLLRVGRRFRRLRR